MHEHFSEHDLARFASDPDSLDPQRRAAIESAIAECATCRGAVDFFAVISDGDFGDVVAEDVTDSSSDDPMRAYVERIAAEDREAEELIEREQLFESPTKTAWKNLQRHKQFLTGGVVRRLNAQANTIYENEPLAALTFADAAISIAETLPDDTYPWNAVFELRGTAWKERANALMVFGDYPGALEALTHAERAYRRLGSAGLGLATVALVRASVLYEQNRLTEARASAEKAEVGFAHLGQEERRTRALFLRASIHYEAHEVATAITLFQHVLEYGEQLHNRRWIARASYAIGNCEVDRRNLAEASMHFHKALVIFRETGPAWDLFATEWGIARVILHGGDRSQAIQRLRHIATLYESRSMLTDAALVQLDLVEALLALGQTKQIVDISARLFQVFKDAGLLPGALSALAYMKEAAASGKLANPGVDAVRVYLRRARRQPDLAFEPPLDRFR